MSSGWGGFPEAPSSSLLPSHSPLYSTGGDQVLLIRLPACESHPGPVTVLQVGPAASAAPAGLCEWPAEGNGP